MELNDFFNAGYKPSYVPESRSESDSETSLSDFIVSDHESDVEGEEEEPIRKKQKRNSYRTYLEDLDDDYAPPKQKFSTSCFFEMKQNVLPIIGRESEAKSLISLIEQPFGGTMPLLVGPHGIGKKSTVAKAAQLYQEAFMDAPFHGRRIFCLSCKELIAESTNIVDGINQLVNDYFSGKKLRAVLYFKDIEELMWEKKIDNFMRALFKQPIPMIASIGQDVADKDVQELIKSLACENFVTFPIKEQPKKEVFDIVQNHLGTNSEKKYQHDAIELSIRLAARHITFPPFPMKAIHALQEIGSKKMIESQFNRVKEEVEIGVLEVAHYFSEKTGIPSEDLLEDSVFNRALLVDKLKKNIVGQDYALEMVANRAVMWKKGYLDPHVPWGAFLFVGPTGVGKTELAKQLAKQLFRDNSSILIFDGSNYKESHTASTLIGAPVGYEGHESGGALTGPLIKNPYRIVLFDEFEKAHDEVRKIFLPALDQGSLTDRQGNVADCTKALFLFTTNVGAGEFFKNSKALAHETLIENLKPVLAKHLSPEMCGRFTSIVPFMAMTKDKLSQLAVVELTKTHHYLLPQAEIDLSWTPKVVTKFSEMDIDLKFGGRAFCKAVNASVIEAIDGATSSNKKRFKGRLKLDVTKKGELTAIILK